MPEGTEIALSGLPEGNVPELPLSGPKSPSQEASSPIIRIIVNRVIRKYAYFFIVRPP